MNRVIISALIAATLFLSAHRPASAVTEFCPATLKYQAVGQPANSTVPSALFGFELTGLAPRTITSAKLAFDTNEGWFTLAVPATTLHAKSRHYDGSMYSFIRTDYVSPVMYARFAKYVVVHHAWVYTANGQSCDPPGSPSKVQQQNAAYESHFEWYTLEPNDDDALAAPPQKTSAAPFVAQISPALEQTNCPVPFQRAQIRDYWRNVYQTGPLAEVALDGNGSVRDTWLWGPPTFRDTESMLLKEARYAHYTGARAYCKAVPSTILFGIPWPRGQDGN